MAKKFKKGKKRNQANRPVIKNEFTVGRIPSQDGSDYDDTANPQLSAVIRIIQKRGWNRVAITVIGRLGSPSGVGFWPKKTDLQSIINAYQSFSDDIDRVMALMHANQPFIHIHAYVVRKLP